MIDVAPPHVCVMTREIADALRTYWAVQGQGREAQPITNERQGREVQRKETDDRV
jgi:hypothetical protein